MGSFARVHTERLTLRPPAEGDAAAIFGRYASDGEVLRYVGWPRHLTIDDTRSFLRFSDAEWKRWPIGPLLIESRVGGELLGSTGLAFETPYRASTGYVLARDAWGVGYAVEALAAVVELAEHAGVKRLYALCHAGHLTSARVLERNGFMCEGILRNYLVFPNLGVSDPQDVSCYSRTKTGSAP
jgi:RimJ/RimL family protein N-acetyltransferase